jgi:hypothetical protein
VTATGTGVSGHVPLPRFVPDPDRPPPPLAPPRTLTGGYTLSGLRSEDQRRYQAARKARVALREAGKAWSDARALGLADGRWMPADAPRATINPQIVDAYLRWLRETATAVSIPAVSR